MTFKEFLAVEEKVERRTWAFIHEHPAVARAIGKLNQHEQKDFLARLGRELNQHKFDFSSGAEAWHQYHAELPRVVARLLSGEAGHHHSPLQSLHSTHPTHRH